VKFWNWLVRVFMFTCGYCYAIIAGDMSDQPATKDDILQLKNFILEREIVAMRWVLGIQITYFGITLAAVWFMINHLPK